MDHVFEEDAHKAKALRETREAAERAFCNVLVNIAATPDGLLFVRWLIGQSQILKSAYPGDHTQAAYREGQRAIGAQLIALARKAGVLPKILEEESNA